MKVKQAVFLLTIYLIVFVVLNVTGLFADIIPYLFTLAPFLVMMTGYTLLKEQRFNYTGLGKDDDWAYHDEPKDRLDVF